MSSFVWPAPMTNRQSCSHPKSKMRSPPRNAPLLVASLRPMSRCARPDGALQPAYSGVRPKLGARGSAAADFVVQGPAVHGIAGLVNLFGIESPGLTSCLAIADEVVSMIV